MQLVQVMLDIARGRVGPYMLPQTRNNAWAAFRHWRRTNPECVPEAVWRALGIEWALLSIEDFDNEFGRHVLESCEVWNELMSEPEGEGCMFWGDTAVLPAWRDPSSSADVYWKLPPRSPGSAKEHQRAPTWYQFEALMQSMYACGPVQLADSDLNPSHAEYHRHQSFRWTKDALKVLRQHPDKLPPPELVDVMLDLARGRVGAWMCPQTRNNAWAAFRHWRSTHPEYVPEETWRALGIEWALLSMEDFSNEFGTHVLQKDELWNQLMTEPGGEGCMFWGSTAVLPAWRDPASTDVFWKLPVSVL